MNKLIKIASVVLLAFGFSGAIWASGGGGEDNRFKDIVQYNLVDGSLGLKGYDPVSYFPEGGGVPTSGLSSLTVDFGGVSYQFANENNMNLFLTEAEKVKSGRVAELKYEPTYGGWCAYAMGFDGSKVDINPILFDFTGGRLHVFADGTKDLWLADKASLEKSADRKWKRILKRGRR